MGKGRTGGRRRRAAGGDLLRGLLRWAAVWVLVLSVVGVVLLDLVVRARFEGAKWSLPAHVYGRVLDLYPGLALSPQRLRWELEQLGYRPTSQVQRPGQYRFAGNRLELYTRPFTFRDGPEPARHLELDFQAGRLEALREGDRPLEVVRLEPLLIGGIYPEHAEDREPVRLDQLPPGFVPALLAVEDRDFYRHGGISPKAVARALLANLRAGTAVQGGSTITQQLVKNFYLSNERSLARKALEAVMAILLELHFDKEEILEAYVNEVFLGQAGRRAIHGFGLAARHYFRQPVGELAPHQYALLIGMVKGASYYNPWRHPERARARRDLVLELMAEAGLLSRAEAAAYRARPLDLAPAPGTSANPYPAYLDLVRRQLQRDYRDEDLKRAGLAVFTHFDPWLQHRLEESIERVLAELERGHRLPPGSLEAAAVVLRVGTADVLAVAGGRRARFSGFNRALDARRSVGSTLKPAVYLAALEQPQRYTLATLLDDSPLAVRSGGRLWRPENYDRRSHGRVPLFLALAHSYNQATVRLGLELGLGRVVETIRRLGYQGPLEEVPALLLGAVAMSPMEVAELYHTIAADGFHTVPRAIAAVSTAEGRPLRHYPFQSEARFAPQVTYLLSHALRVAVAEGTGAVAARRLPEGLAVAGKTGTTNDQRDSWFSGFTGEHLAVVWIGRDDNGRMPLTGSSGALRLWVDLMAGIDTRPLSQLQPEGIEWHWIELATGRRSGAGCSGARLLPFLAGSAPRQLSPCGHLPEAVREGARDLMERLREWLGR
ncbi:MAG: penicillin-binding protein 1B [Porticoccaceae bacterium]|nr:MAG: penicillin-binding protein 1B [Porticoccaceae bacterium]